MSKAETQINKPSLCWFSPLPPAKTGIADYTAQILPYLVKHANVTLWTDQKQYDRTLERYAKVRRYEPLNLDLKSIQGDFDEVPIPIYHVGNNGELHQSIWEASQRLPGITVLHDTRLQHLFAHVIRDSYGDLDLYVQLMKTYYGEHGFRSATRFLAGGYTTEDMAAQFPLVRLAARGSSAAIVHSEESRRLLQAEGYSGAVYFPFPYASQSSPTVRTGGPPYRIVICGYLGPNRRIESFFRALGSFSQKEKFKVEVYGPIWDPALIANVLREERLADSVQLFGYRPLADLDRSLQGAHLAVNLRYPTMGEASMSQLQLWDHAIASMVTPVGWYGHLPKGTVLYVRPDHEVEDIQKHLLDFLRDPAEFFAMGERARQTLRAEHDPEQYAVAIARFASEYGWHARRRAGFELADRVAGEMKEWVTTACYPLVADRTAAEICALTNSE